MSFEKTTDRINCSQMVYEGYAEEGLENDIRLADYYPDVEQILKMELIPQITGRKISGDKLYIDGTAVTRVFYISADSGQLHCVAVSQSFAKSFELKGAVNSDAQARATAVVQYKNARLVSPRKLEIRASIGISVKVYDRVCQTLLTGVEDDNVQLQRRNILVGDYIGYGERTQRINEEMAIPETKPGIACVLRSTAYIKLEEVKAITNKAILKGEMETTVLYLAEESHTLERMEYSIPVTQIVDLEGLSEDCAVEARLELNEHKCEMLSGQNGESRALRMEAQVTASLKAYMEREISVCCDAYSTQEELLLTTQNLQAERMMESHSLSNVVKETLEFSASEVKQIYDVWGAISFLDTVENEDGLEVKGNLCVTVMAYDHEDRLCCVDSDVPVSIQLPYQASQTQLRADARLSLAGMSYTLSGESYIELRAEVLCDVTTYYHTEVRAITDVEADEEHKKERAGKPLTIYYADAGESVWEIAKHYNASIQSLMDDNNLESEVLAEPAVLAIYGR